MVSFGQDVIDLNSGKKIEIKVAGDNEQVMVDKKTGNRTVFNINKPSLTIYKPAAEKSNGIAMIVCPGGAFHVLDIDNEGYNVAKILVEHGYTAILLKYRLLVLDPKNPFAGMEEAAKDNAKLDAKMAPAIPGAIADAKATIKYVKANAASLAVDPAKVGMIGFSAGGTLAAAIGFESDEQYKPAFFATLYPYLDIFDKNLVPKDAAPLFIAVAADDDYGFDANSLKLYQKWKIAGASSELHVYAKGRHGFGTKKQNLPVDNWIDRFAEWLDFIGYGSKKLDRP